MMERRRGDVLPQAPGWQGLFVQKSGAMIKICQKKYSSFQKFRLPLACKVLP